MSIQVLPPEVASAIAAGEVVERPASVVKELVENALDAGARRVDIEIEGAGRKLIRVADDGEGIAADDLELALERHATSKLRSREDLFAIRSLGFRGEALSSIAAVSRFELVSRSEPAPAGRALLAESGEIKELRSVGAPKGTVVVVRDLFYNVPARRKFLKSDNTERRHIADLVTRYALAYPGVRFGLEMEARSAFQASGNGNRREILAEIYGLERAQEMIALPGSDAGLIRVQGFISPPSIQRSNRRELTFFVNGRWVRDASLSAAVLQAYHGLLMVGRYPLVVLFLHLPEAAVDVNVHPTKSEVRFDEPGKVFSVVQRAVRATLLRQAPPPQVDFQGGWARPEDGSQASGMISPDWALAGEMRPPSESMRLLPPDAPEGSVPLLRAVGQVGAAYLVAEGPDGLYLIDQHAAHERILFEAFMRAFESGGAQAQSLLEPATVELTPAQAALMEERLEVLRDLGFQVEAFGSRTYRVRAVPSQLQALDPEAALRVVVEDFEEDEAPFAEEVEAMIAARVCKRAAVKSGQVLSLEEQRRLIHDLERTQSPRTCPHGRPTLIHLSVEALERQFGRRG